MNSNGLINQPIYVVGAGGIGVVMAWCLIKSGVAVTVIETNINKIKYGNQHGIEISGHGAVTATLVPFEHWEPEPDALVLLCTKTYTNAEVLNKLPESTTLFPVQNGFDKLLETYPHDCAGIVSFVSECNPDNTVTRITRKGEFHIGRRSANANNNSALLLSLENNLKEFDLFSLKVVDNITPYKYAKLMYNAAISPLASAAGIDNSELLNNPVAKKLFIALLRENYAILNHAGINLEKVGPIHPDLVNKILSHPLVVNLFALFFKPSLKGTYCSMAPDIHTNNTEIDAYNGHLVTLAGNFPCPLNRAAIDMINNVISNQLSPDMEHLHSMLDSLPEGVLS